MEWLELTIKTASEGIELLEASLTLWGYDSFVTDDETEFQDFLEGNRDYWDYVDDALAEKMRSLSQIRLYLEDGPAAMEELARLRTALAELKAAYPDAGLGELSVSLANVREEDWENNWKQYYHPIAVGSRLLVVPKWLSPENPEGRIPVLLDPGMIFGTGNHASTRMCMESLESLVRPGDRVLDLGSGSGILSIAALLLGAKAAIGVDIDPKAEDIARENAGFNGLFEDRFTALTGNVLGDEAFLTGLGTDYELVLANIVADVIIPLSPLVPKLLGDGGHFICSGILAVRLPEVLSALDRAGLRVVTSRQEDDWCCLTCVRKEE